MKIKKIAIGLLSFCLILGIIFVFKNFFISVSVKYLPTELKNVIKYTLNKKNEFLINSQNINEKLFNDYNVKFLPETQKLKLNFEKYPLQFIPKSEIGYFQKLVEKKANIYKSFYIDGLDNDRLILTDAIGNSYFVSDINNLDLSLKISNILLMLPSIPEVIDKFSSFSLKNLDSILEEFKNKFRGIYINSSNLINVLKNIIEIVELIKIKGSDKKIYAINLLLALP